MGDGSSILDATTIDPWPVRAVAGGLPSGIAALVAFGAADGFRAVGSADRGVDDAVIARCRLGLQPTGRLTNG